MSLYGNDSIGSVATIKSFHGSPAVVELEINLLARLVVAISNAVKLIDDDRLVATTRAGYFYADLRKFGTTRCHPFVSELDERTNELSWRIVDIDFKLQLARFLGG